ncbi:MAG TPA: long-chain fatty acid--CoA ligase [Frankiaceae bacterium]|nr:long-chain fatty acid--CoA ligase [Frankiaceae bacterium]
MDGNQTTSGTVGHAFLDMVDRQGDAPALRWKSGDGFTTWTWREYADAVARTAGGLRALGFASGERAVLLMHNQPAFHVCDLAVLFNRGVPISIYTSSSPEQIAWLTGHCDATLCFVDSALLDRVLAVRDRLPKLRHIVVIDDEATVDGREAEADVIPLSKHAGSEPVDLRTAADELQPGDLATVIYTSGTTGPPKGVMITHANVLAQWDALRAHIGLDGHDQRVVSYLPMAHIAERVVSHYLPVFWGSQVTTCPDMGQLGQYLTDVRPTFFFGPPRVFEKMYAAVHASLAAADPERQAGFERALAVGHRVAELRAREQELPDELAEQWARVDAVALAPIRQLLGIDQMQIMVSGAAPIPVEVLEFMRDLGAPMSELFGMSENTGAMIWDSVRVRPGRVGRRLEGTEIAIGADGELLCRGPIVCSGYLNDPTRTAEALDRDGWLHTGDIASVDDDGYVRIVDRKKELIVTAGGKNVSPANLEAELKTIPLVGQVMVVGDARPYLAALLVLDPEVAPAWAKSHGIAVASLAELSRHPAVIDAVAKGVAAVNQLVSQAEAIRRFVLLSDEWTPDSEELTPTMKVKRRGVLHRYGPRIEELYSGGGLSVDTVRIPEQGAPTKTAVPSE